MSLWPNEPTGGGVLASWCRKLLRACRASELRPGVGYTVRRSSGGTVLEIGPRGGGAGGSSVVKLTFQSMGDDHIVCHDASDNDVNVAKPQTLRFSETLAVLPTGTTLNFSDFSATAQSRVSTDNLTATVTEYIAPPYCVEKEIYALLADTGVTVGGEALSLIDLNLDARTWGGP